MFKIVVIMLQLLVLSSCASQRPNGPKRLNPRSVW